MGKVSTSLRQKMSMRLSPDQILVARLLEIPAVELSQRINEELEENPTLEEVEGSGDRLEDAGYSESEMDGDGGYSESGDGEVDRGEETGVEEYEDAGDDEYVPVGSSGEVSSFSSDYGMVASVSLIEHLKSQIYLTKMDKAQRHIAKWVIGNIDDDGFLRRSAEQLCNDLYFQEGLEVSEEAMEGIISQIRRFDPPGIASSSLRECLLIQLEGKQKSAAVCLAIEVLKRFFDAFSSHKYEYLCDQLQVSLDDLRLAVDEIKRLVPRPVNAFTENAFEKNRSTIVPDFYVESRDGGLSLYLNTSSIPGLQINRDYEQMLTRYESKSGKSKDKQAIKFLRGKLNDARWFIKAIQERNETLFKTMSAILDFQKEFFLEGDVTYLKPMILQDIATKTGYDISTISRVSNSKFVQTDFGLFPLRYFFSDSYQKQDGEVISTKEIKEALVDIIQKEDKSHPFNDDELVEKMRESGYEIARRTITKYRKLLNIPIAKLRKKL